MLFWMYYQGHKKMKELESCYTPSKYAIIFETYGHKKTSAVLRQQKYFVGLGLKFSFLELPV